MWEQHRDLILVTIILVQAVLIAALLLQALRKRRAGETCWRSAFDASTLGMALVDRELKFVAANAAFRSMLGYGDSELRGLTPLDILVEEDREASRRLHGELAQGARQCGDLVGRYRRKDGPEVWAHVYLSAIPGQDPRLVLATAIDITSRKLAEDAARVAQSDLARIARLITVGEMTASIAHEINQPLGAVVANGNAGLRWLARATPDIEEARAALKRIVNEGHRAGQVIGGIRSMFKKDGGTKAPHDVNELVREVLALVHGEVEKERVTVRTELVDELPPVLVDRAQLRHVILNLVSNAIDAMNSQNGRARVLRLRSEHAGDNVMVTVEDSGSGIDRENMNRIFEAFFTTKPQGMGMGLSICRSIVESHGGRLSAACGHPHGAVFQVVLPGHQPGAE
jgi:PAS domain S-box-containing protein